MSEISPSVISVSAFIAILNETLGFAYPEVIVEGEVSSFKVNQGKWVFFDLKDDEATLGCFLPLSALKVELEDGMKIRAAGTPRLTKWGKFSFTVRRVELAGEGALKRAFELLKARLDQEGLFDPKRKRPLPRFPQRIGLITSAQSAAYSDFMKILHSRWSGVEVLVADVQVQGLAAPDQICGAFDELNQLPQPVEVIVLIRGGGSLEDLQAFNSEAVARKVAGSRAPTIVGVGHEVDISLADFAADCRAVTPTDAARIVVPDAREMANLVATYRASLGRCLDQLLARTNQHLASQVLRLERFISWPRQQLAGWQDRLMKAASNLLQRDKVKVEHLTRLIKGFDPAAILRRGYSITTHQQRVVTASSQVPTGGSVMIQLAEGTIKATRNE
jgi:exodeoxyribonuclease VII large subunit